MQICSELLIEKMFYYKFFCQTIQCPQKEGGRIPPPSDVSPTEKHADVTRVKVTNSWTMVATFLVMVEKMGGKNL